MRPSQGTCMPFIMPARRHSMAHWPWPASPCCPPWSYTACLELRLPAPLQPPQRQAQREHEEDSLYAPTHTHHKWKTEQKTKNETKPTQPKTPSSTSTTKKIISYSPSQRIFLFTLGSHPERPGTQCQPVASEEPPSAHSVSGKWVCCTIKYYLVVSNYMKIYTKIFASSKTKPTWNAA